MTKDSKLSSFRARLGTKMRANCSLIIAIVIRIAAMIWLEATPTLNLPWNSQFQVCNLQKSVPSFLPFPFLSFPFGFLSFYTFFYLFILFYRKKKERKE